MANYDDWTAAVHDELKAVNEDVEYAYEWYSFRSAYEDGMKPKEAVKDYVKWMEG